MKIIKGIFIGILILILVLIICFFGYKLFTNICINQYIEAQGLKNAERLEDSGVKWSGKTGNVERVIVYKEAPEIKYVYSRSDPTVSLPVLLNLGANEGRFKGIIFEHEREIKDGEYYVTDRSEVEEGKVDERGKLVKPFDWKNKQ